MKSNITFHLFSMSRQPSYLEPYIDARIQHTRYCTNLPLNSLEISKTISSHYHKASTPMVDTLNLNVTTGGTMLQALVASDG